jgi:hypothetical protein
MLAALLLAALAGLFFQPRGRGQRTLGGHPVSDLGVVILAVAAGLLCILAAFLWFRYLVIDPVGHLGELFD